MKYLLSLFCFVVLISCSADKLYTNPARVQYNKTNNTTHITNYFYGDTVTVPGFWKPINKLINNTDVSPHYLGLENENKDQIELICSRTL